MERNDKMEVIIHQLCGKNIVRRISTKPFNVYKYETGVDVEIVKNRQGDPDWTKLVNSLVENKTRNTQILELVAVNFKSFKILVMTLRVGHAQYLCDLFNSYAIPSDYMASDKKTYIDKGVLVGTVSKIGTGFDERTVCETFDGNPINLLILTGTISSRPLLEQVAGRCFRSQFPHIIYMIDDNKISENHWKKNRPWFKSRNGKVEVIRSSLATEKQTQKIDQAVAVNTRATEMAENLSHITVDMSALM